MSASITASSLVFEVQGWGVQVIVKEDAGKLLFTVEVIGSAKKNISDLRGLFFDVKDDALSGLTVSGGQVADRLILANSVTKVGSDGLNGKYANDKSIDPNKTYDVGVEFIEAAKGQSGIQSASFVLSAPDRNLTLDLVAGQYFGIRLGSPSAKLIVKAPGSQPDPVPVGVYDDLIEGGDGNDSIYGGFGNDEMQGEGGDDLIVGGVDDGVVVWGQNGLHAITIGDNLYGNDGNDVFVFDRGDGVDLIWDFQPGKDVIKTSYKSNEIFGVTLVGKVDNRLDAGSHGKIALFLGDGRDAILFNDFPAPGDKDAAIVFADGKSLSSAALLEMAKANLALGEALKGQSTVSGARPSAPGGTAKPLDLYGTNDGDTLIGGAGDDRLYGNEGVNGLNGRAGNDRLFGGNVQDVLLAEDGDDIVTGNGGDDLIVGGNGADKLYGGGGADIIYGDGASQSVYDTLSPTLVNPPDWSGPDVTASFRITGNWWGGFQGEITITANESIADWELALRSHFKIDSIWGADKSSPVTGQDGSFLYTLDNASWNGSLSRGQTTTIGFTAKTNIAGVIDESLIMNAVAVGDVGAPLALAPLPNASDVDADVTVTGAWAGGFQGEITITARENITHWDLLLKSEFKFTLGSVWGAERRGALSEGDGNVFSLSNAKWNGVLAKGQTITIGFTAKTKGDLGLSAERIDELLTVADDGGNVTTTVNAATGASQVKGGVGDDILYGGAAKDVLTGLEGKDTFVFTTKPNKKTNVDKITDFSVADDSFQLDNAVFKKLGTKGSPDKAAQLSKAFFTVGSKAKDKNDYLVYDSKKGVLSYDADGSGSGAAVQVATLSKKLNLSHKDFFVI